MNQFENERIFHTYRLQLQKYVKHMTSSPDHVNTFARFLKNLDFLKKRLAICKCVCYNSLASSREQSIIWRCRLAGRGRTTGNRVTVKSGSRVRISPSPPEKKHLLSTGQKVLLFWQNKSLGGIVKYRKVC